MIAVSYPIQGGSLVDVGTASRRLKEQLKRIGVQAGVMRRIMIAAYEAEANVAIHASRGTLFARLVDGRIDMEVVDEGPGIQDVDRAMTAGYSTASEEARKLGFGAGMGLPNIRKACDRFEIETRVGQGTRVVATIFFQPEAHEETAAACSPHLRRERCVSCLACVRACPMEAIRLRPDGPEVLEHLCIGCAACVESCRHGVFAVAEGAAFGEAAAAGAGLSVLAAPAALLGAVARDPRDVLAALMGAGFREVRLFEEWEEALVASALRASAVAGALRPVIAPVCAAVVNLIESSFPSMLPHLMGSLSPAVAAAHELDLGHVVAVVGCPAQAAALESELPTGRVRICTPSDLARMARREAPSGSTPGAEVPRGNGAASEGVVRADGVRRAMKVLAEAERGLLGDIAVLDLRACEGGCAGSPLFAEDPAVSRERLLRAGIGPGRPEGGRAAVLPRRRPYAPRRGVRLDEDMGRAMEKLRRIDSLTRSLPGRDCAVCGSPSCASFAEDLVLGRTESRCPYEDTGGAR